MALSILPSGSWLGNDGSWSAFFVHVGNPAQPLRVLPATSKSAVFVVLEQSCDNITWGSQSVCAETRGSLFDHAKDGSWVGVKANDDSPYFVLPFQSEGNLPNYALNGEVGTDELSIDWPSTKHAPGPLKDQYIVGYEAWNPWIGLLGLSGYSSHIFSGATVQNSTLRSLQNGKAIHSLYWGYTAGASYAQPKVPGSLTFGGYDTARTDMGSAITVQFDSNSDTDLTVPVTSITISGMPLVGSEITALIDSVVPEIWLPTQLCYQFESAYGLVWNETVEMYLMNDTQHEKLTTENPTAVFALAATPGQPSGTSITLPYAAFDLTASFPLAGISDSTTTLRYFPLKRANATQLSYLGRTFLQEAYVTADYDRGVFTVSPAVHASPASAKLQVIYPPGYHHPLSTGAIAGIAVGATAIGVIVLGLLFWLWRRRKAQHKRLDGTETETVRTGSIGNTTVFGDMEMNEWQQREYFKPDLPSDPNEHFGKQELDATAKTYIGQPSERHELDADSTRPKGHRHGLSWDSHDSGVSSMTDDRIRSAMGEPSPPIFPNRPSSPPQAGRRHSRHHSAGSPRGLFEMPESAFEMQGSSVRGRLLEQDPAAP